jgi:hypothetical protein
MKARHELTDWLIRALRELGGKGTNLDIARQIWKTRSKELQASGDLFYEWQYELRWSATLLNSKGKIKPADKSKETLWVLVDGRSPK